jgi:hypothetical protein
MTQDVARRSIDWLHDHGCRVLALMGGEPLLRPDFVHKVVYYAAKKGFWIYIATNGRLLKPDFADRWAMQVCRFSTSHWTPGISSLAFPRHSCRPKRTWNTSCANNMCTATTDYHINETPMLEQDGHFKHLSENPTYIRPEDWREIDALVDWLIDKNKTGYQMVNSVQWLQEIKAFVRMSFGLDLKKYGWNGDGVRARTT